MATPITPDQNAVDGTPVSLAPQGEPWDTIAATLKNPAGIADFPQDLPPDSPVFNAVVTP